MKKTKPAIVEALFTLLIFMIFVGEVFQTIWLIENWIFLTNLAKFGEIFVMFFFPLAAIIVFCEIFIGFNPKRKIYFNIFTPLIFNLPFSSTML